MVVAPVSVRRSWGESMQQRVQNKAPNYLLIWPFYLIVLLVQMDPIFLTLDY